MLIFTVQKPIPLGPTPTRGQGLTLTTVEATMGVAILKKVRMY